ncbi:carboxymuconolactone decarboxylase family protein [Amorphus sp. 3PC139-8]|uniref:carboxymuconolactone decarboxylase family protein n=1 Tax=Amorphus sp. 3PC139-8 TaxID=2735676 RepID=UPI00345D767C
MSIMPVLSDEEAGAAARAVFDDIRDTRQTDFVNNFWRVLANDPALLARTWDKLKAVMGPGSIDPLVKEMIYVAVSVTNGCQYCIHSHTAAARAKGMTDQQLMELMAVVGAANETNRLVNGLQVPVDEAFLSDPKA